MKQTILEKVKQMDIENDRIFKAVYQAESALARIGVPIGTVTSVKVNPRYTSRWGCCITDHHYTQDVYGMLVDSRSYHIEISPKLVTEEAPFASLYETVLHEYLHTVPGCQNHGPEWKKWAAYVNQKLHVSVTRTCSSEKLGIKRDPVEYKYALRCRKCGQVIRRRKRSKLIEHPEWYRCKCGGELERIWDF